MKMAQIAGRQREVRVLTKAQYFGGFVSDFARGQKVRLTKDCQVLHMAEIVKAGETGTLGKMYRIQDGFEIWHMRLDRPGYVFLAVDHTAIEKILDI